MRYGSFLRVGSLSARNTQRPTPLEEAAASENLSIIELLIRRGADPSYRDRDIDFIYSYNHMLRIGRNYKSETGVDVQGYDTAPLSNIFGQDRDVSKNQTGERSAKRRLT